MTNPFLSSVQEYVKANPDRDLILFSRGISRQLHRDIGREIQQQQRNNACTLIMTTYGGDPHGGFRIARCIRHHYQHVRVVIPSFCKSAGTLIAICADELAIGDYGELGPLDVQVSKPTEFMERSSGLDIMQALQMNLNHAQEAFRKCLIDVRSGGRLSTKLAGEFASKIAIGVAEPLYAQIDPNRIGELQRAMRIAHEYGERLNRYGKNLKEGALNQLIAGYPSHDFVIDRKEASELFSRVQSLSAEEVAVSSALWFAIEDESNYGPHILNVVVTGEEHDGDEQVAGQADGDAGDFQPIDTGGTDEQSAGSTAPADQPADQNTKQHVPGELGQISGDSDG